MERVTETGSGKRSIPLESAEMRYNLGPSKATGKRSELLDTRFICCGDDLEKLYIYTRGTLTLLPT